MTDRNAVIEECAREVETHWNDSQSITNQRDQAFRSAARIRALKGAARPMIATEKVIGTNTPGGPRPIDMTRTLCGLCYGDGWIEDSINDHRRCTEQEKLRFLERMGSGTGRMACPRCQPNWIRPLAVAPSLRHALFMRRPPAWRMFLGRFWPDPAVVEWDARRGTLERIACDLRDESPEARTRLLQMLVGDRWPELAAELVRDHPPLGPVIKPAPPYRVER